MGIIALIVILFFTVAVSGGIPHACSLFTDEDDNV